MALTKNERRALELARERIATRRSDAVCLALWKVSKELPELTGAAIRLTDYIQHALGKAHVLSAWQDREFGYTRWHEIRADRLAWIDWMLDQPEIE